MLFKRKSRSSMTILQASSDNDNDNDKNNKEMNEEPAAETNPDKDETQSKLKSKFLSAWNVVLTRTLSAFPTIKVAFGSFVTGLLLSGALILVPVYNSVDQMTEPVTLFETILADLDQGYVDTVDTKQLFETGVSAMLRSLDPYTEFEGRQEAQDLNESVSGKYGGIGLVITGATTPQQEEAAQVDVALNNNDKPSSTTPQDKILPKEALEDKQRMEDDEDMISADDFEREEMIQEKMNENKALKKAMDKGIRVVSAFEGYSFDYGMR